MRVDPEGIYLELLPGSHTFNIRTGELQARDAVRLNWKPDPRPGTRWAHRAFVGDSLAEVLRGFADYLVDHTLDELLGREPTDAAV